MTTATIWTDFARSYDRVLRNWDPYLALVGKAERHLGNARRVLEQGCGTGIVAEALARRGVAVEGIDNNVAMLEVAERCAIQMSESFRSGSFRAREGDALNVPFGSTSFDGVVSNNVIFYVDDPLRLLREARRVLIPGCTLAISGPQPNPDLALLDREIEREFNEKGLLPKMVQDLDHFRQCSRQLKRTGMPNVYRLKDIVELLRREGFVDVVEADDTVYYGQSWFVAAR